MALSTSGRGAAVVTGGARGLGLAIATVLHSRGYAVHLTDVDGAAATAAAAALGGWASPLDVRDEAACVAVAQASAEQAGGLAAWVNNAGILVTGASWSHDAATRRRVFEVNTLGAMNGTLAALAVMRMVGRGHVVNVVSLAGLVAPPGETVYAASKHALLAFSLGTLAELRAAGYRQLHLSCICPDGIWTPMLHDRLADDAAAASFTGRLLRPSQVAARVGRLVEHPRPVVSMPRWRGAQARLFDAVPGVSTRLARPMLALGRAAQRRHARRIASARWP